MIYTDISNENQNNQGNLLRDRECNVSEEKAKFVKKSYPRPWQVELTDEEIEVLRKNLKEDEIRYEAKAKDWLRINHLHSYLLKMGKIGDEQNSK